MNTFRSSLPTVPLTAASATTAEAGLRTCRVVASADSNWIVQDGNAKSCRARRAVSCLVLPEVGDIVACLTDGDGHRWMLEVLERKAGEAGAPVKMRIDGDLHTEIQGEWRVEAARLHVGTADAEVHTQRAILGFDTFRSTGRMMQIAVQQTRWVGQELVAVLGRWVQRSQSTHRHTEGIEQVHAGHMELASEGVVHIKAPHVLTEGSDLVKTRGSQIHFG